MQTAALLGRAGELGMALAAVLVVTETATGERLGDEAEAAAATQAGEAAAAALSPST